MLNGFPHEWSNECLHTFNHWMWWMGWMDYQVMDCLPNGSIPFQLTQDRHMISILFVFEGGGCNSMNLNALNAFTGWLADWLTGCLADWVTGYLHPWMHWMHWMHRMHWMHWLGDWVTGRSHPWMHRMIDLVNALNGWLGDWVFGLNGWMGQWMHWIGEWVNVLMG